MCLRKFSELNLAFKLYVITPFYGMNGKKKSLHYYTCTLFFDILGGGGPTSVTKKKRFHRITLLGLKIIKILFESLLIKAERGNIHNLFERLIHFFLFSARKEQKYVNAKPHNQNANNNKTLSQYETLNYESSLTRAHSTDWEVSSPLHCQAQLLTFAETIAPP